MVLSYHRDTSVFFVDRQVDVETALPINCCLE